MKNNNGFSLVEVLVVLSFIAILSVLAIPNFKKYAEKSRKLSENRPITNNSLNENVSCIEGYKFIRNSHGNEQIIDTMGKGIKCN